MAKVQSTPYRDRSKLTDQLLDEDKGGPYYVHLDCWLTRRKRFHIITDAEAGVVYRSRWMPDIIDWLDKRGQHAYFFQFEAKAYRISMRRGTRIQEPKP